LPMRFVQGKTSLQNKHLDSQISMTRTALKVPENFNAESGYTYSNANYAILGSLVGAMSGGSYGEVCKTRIMDPANALNANVSGRMAKTAGYGGWSRSKIMRAMRCIGSRRMCLGLKIRTASRLIPTRAMAWGLG
jgi:CubicO group peptidase (beta-lactamase class C family)